MRTSTGATRPAGPPRGCSRPGAADQDHGRTQRLDPGTSEAKWGYTQPCVADWDRDGLPDSWSTRSGARSSGSATSAPGAPGSPRPSRSRSTGRGLAPEARLDLVEPRGRRARHPVADDPVRGRLERRRPARPRDARPRGLPRPLRAGREGRGLRLKPGPGLPVGARLGVRRPPPAPEPDRRPAPAQLRDGRGQRPRKLCVADWDGDGRPDLLVDGRNANVLRNWDDPRRPDHLPRHRPPGGARPGRPLDLSHGRRLRQGRRARPPPRRRGRTALLPQESPVAGPRRVRPPLPETGRLLMRRRRFLEGCGAGLAGLLAARGRGAGGRGRRGQGAGDRAPTWPSSAAGSAGCAAALAALRGGRTVVLTEPTDWIGGQLTPAGRAARRAPLDRAVRRQRLVLRPPRRGIRDYYRPHYPLTAEARAGPHLNPGDGGVSRLCHEPRVALAVLTDAARPVRLGRASSTVLLEHAPVRAEVDGDRVRAVTVRDAPRRATSARSSPRTSSTPPSWATCCRWPAPSTSPGSSPQSETGEPHAPPEAASPTTSSRSPAASRWTTSTARTTRSTGPPSTPSGATTCPS